MRRFAPLALALAVFVVGAAGTRHWSHNSSQDIRLERVPFDPTDPARIEIGGLRYIAGWKLGGDNEAFGGISALIALSPHRFLGISDAGTVIGFGISGDVAADRPFIAPLPGTRGAKVDFADRDSESATRDPVTGRMWVGFEQRAAIRRYSSGLARLEATGRPAAMRAWPKNSGAEAMVRLRDGRFIVLEEGGLERPTTTRGLLFAGDPTVPDQPFVAFDYAPPAGFNVTDAAQLPDGRVVLLHRKLGIDGFTAAIAIADPSMIVPDGLWRGRVVAELVPPLTVDNMEGIAVTQEAGSVILWIVSDDNFTKLQRTLLLKFALNLDAIDSSALPKPAAGTKKPETPAPGFDAMARPKAR